ncbi:MAG: hypothetical protein U5K29_11080 [Acidimicrobiales bacterium]|nr:hypothetical protein [Acidimicrobiales bacterium]
MLGDDPQPELGFVAVNPHRGTEDHRGPVVHRMVERRSGEHQRVDMGHLDTDRRTPTEVTQESAGDRSVEVQRVAVTAIEHRDDDRPTIGDDAHVAQRARVEDRVDRLGVVGGPGRVATDAAEL